MSTFSSSDITPRQSATYLRKKCKKAEHFSYVYSSTAELCFRYIESMRANITDANSQCALYGSRLIELDTKEKCDLMKDALLTNCE